MATFRKLRNRLTRYGLPRTLATLGWQRELPLKTPLTRRLELLRGGFTDASYRTYDLENNDVRDYLPDIAAGSHNSRRSNGFFAVSLMSDKLLSYTVLRPYLDLPRLLALVERGRIFPFHASESAPAPRGQGSGIGDLGALLERCEREGGVILKPSRGMKGGGVLRLEGEGGRLEVNGEAVTSAEVARLVSGLDDYLIEARVAQAAYAASIFPGSANTIRLVTMRDVDRGGEPFVAAAIHKFSTSETVPTDNWTRGGLSAWIDLQTGTLGPAVRSPARTGDALLWSAHHPDTGARIEGVRVPD